MAENHLATYLNDHLAGSQVALELLGHLARTHPDAPAGRLAAALRADVLADREELESLMARLHVAASTPRRAAAWMAEKAAVLKLWLDDPSGGALRLLELFEAVSVGIEGKRLLWLSLSAAGVAGLSAADCNRLVRRAEEQRQRVEPLRLETARAAVGPACEARPATA